MDVDTIDMQYRQLEQEAQSVGQAIQAYAQKLQAAAEGGDPNAREWLLDLKGITLQVQQEQLQMQSLCQAMHGFFVNTMQPQGQPQGQPQYQQQNQPSYQQAPGFAGQQGQGGGMLQRFMGGGFGQAVAMGAGFGIGDELIQSIF